MPQYTQHYRPIFRAFDTERRLMIYDEREALAVVNTPGFVTMQWIGQTDDSPEQRKIFQGDICAIEIRNSFGSITKHISQVGYDAKTAQYIHDIIENKTRIVIGGDIIRAVVIGHAYERIRSQLLHSS